MRDMSRNPAQRTVLKSEIPQSYMHKGTDLWDKASICFNSQSLEYAMTYLTQNNSMQLTSYDPLTDNRFIGRTSLYAKFIWLDYYRQLQQVCQPAIPQEISGFFGAPRTVRIALYVVVNRLLVQCKWSQDRAWLYLVGLVSNKVCSIRSFQIVDSKGLQGNKTEISATVQLA